MAHQNAKLSDADVAAVVKLARHRDALKAQIARLSNANIAAAAGVHVRTIDRITAERGWLDVPRAEDEA